MRYEFEDEMGTTVSALPLHQYGSRRLTDTTLPCAQRPPDSPSLPPSLPCAQRHSMCSVPSVLMDSSNGALHCVCTVCVCCRYERCVKDDDAATLLSSHLLTYLLTYLLT